MPFNIKVPCVGGQYHSFAAAREAGLLTQGVIVELRREPTNQYDENAIEVFTLEPALKLGYVAKNFAAGLAPMLDEGKMKLVARIELVRDRSCMVDVREVEENDSNQNVLPT